MFGLGGRRRLPVDSAEAKPRSDEHEEDFGSDPPGADLEPRGADAQRPAQVTAHLDANGAETTQVLKSPGSVC